MATKAKTNGRLTEELLETAHDMRASGLMSRAAREKITIRHSAPRTAHPATLRSIRGSGASRRKKSGEG